MKLLLAETRFVSLKPSVVLCAAIVLFATEVLALDPTTTDPRKVMQAVEDQDEGDKQTAKVTMTLEDSSGRKRVRELQVKALKFDGGRKMLMLFESPADVRNTGLLSIDYDGDKDDDQWLYLPSLKKSTRISSSGRSGSFLGTDISYADMTSKDINAYEYKMIEKSTKVDGEDCWLIEARPKTEKEKTETGYVKTHSWISKSKLIPLQGKAWVSEGRKLKYLKFDQVEKIDGIWVARKLSVRTVKNGKVESTTLMEYKSIKFNQDSVTDAEFTERRLERGL